MLVFFPSVYEYVAPVRLATVPAIDMIRLSPPPLYLAEPGVWRERVLSKIDKWVASASGFVSMLHIVARVRAAEESIYGGKRANTR